MLPSTLILLTLAPCTPELIPTGAHPTRACFTFLLPLLLLLLLLLLLHPSLTAHSLRQARQLFPALRVTVTRRVEPVVRPW